MLAGPVLRPWAERLVDLVRPRFGETALDLPCGCGAMGSLLARAVGRTGRVILADEDSDARAECVELADSLGCPQVQVHAAPPWPTTRVDVATSLFELPHAVDPAAALEALLAAVASRGRLVVAVWGPAGSVPHEEAVRDGLHRVGAGTPFIDAALSFGGDGALAALVAPRGRRRALPRELTVERLVDVVRFEGVDHLWSCLVSDRPLVAAPVSLLDARGIAVAKAHIAERLRPWAARDGTLVIRVEAVVLRVSGVARHRNIENSRH